METYFGNVNPIGPRACYDEGKRIAETMCYAYNKQSGVEVNKAKPPRGMGWAGLGWVGAGQGLCWVM